MPLPSLSASGRIGVFIDWIRAFFSIEASNDHAQPVVLGSVDHWVDNGGLHLCAWHRLIRDVAPPEMYCLNGTAQVIFRDLTKWRFCGIIYHRGVW
jgi:hypothetical protein